MSNILITKIQMIHKIGLISVLKSMLSKYWFFLGNNPQITNTTNNKKSYIPKDKKSVVLISADFELAWGPRYSKYGDNSLDHALFLAKRERENIPPILQLAEKYNIPITWATTGHLFLKECRRIDGRAHTNIPDVPSYSGKYWNFNGPDWFEFDPCSDHITDPLWYAPDLIELIIGSDVPHEIACHTFSHIDCRDGICPPQLFRAELKECKKFASKQGLKLQTFVHPGHSIGNINVLAEEGFTSFRSNFRNVLGAPLFHHNGIIEFEQTAGLNFRKEWSTGYHLFRYKSIIKRAMKTNTLCVLWFHPSFDQIMIEEVLPVFFQFLDERREELWITTHGEYASWLNKNNGR